MALDAGQKTIGDGARELRAKLLMPHLEPGQAKALAQAILALSADPSSATWMGARARAMLDERFTRRHAYQQWRNVFDRIGQPAAVQQ